MDTAKVVRIATRLPKREPKKSTPRPWGSVTERNGLLYATFSYLGQRFTVPAGGDTPDRRRRLRTHLDGVGAKVRGMEPLRMGDQFPLASPELRRRWQEMEGRGSASAPEDVTFGAYVEAWTGLDGASKTKRRDFNSALSSRILPAFADLTFGEINGVVLVRFVESMAGLSSSRINNVLLPLRQVWEDAVEEHGWDLSDPFEHLKRRNRGGRLIPPRRRREITAFRWEEYRRLVAACEEWWRPVVELQTLTGMICSEVQRVRRADIDGDTLPVRGTKTRYRGREMPIGTELRRVLGTLAAQGDGKHLVHGPNGVPFAQWKSANVRFRNGPWSRALRAAGLEYRHPYTMRHTFAAWSLIAGVPPARLVRLMGHGSKKMVYETYGDYVEGMEADTEAIRAYLGVEG